MTTQLHDSGEEYLQKVVMDGTISRVTSVQVGLFNDATAGLTDGSDSGNIAGEPGGAAYATQTVNLNGTDVTTQQTGGDWEAVFKDLTYDTSDSSASVDAYYVEMTVQLSGDGSATAHLLFTGDLDQTYDLSQISQFTLKSAGLSIS